MGTGETWLATRYSAGLGDLLQDYFGVKQDAGLWAEIARQHPDVRVEVVCPHVNPRAQELFDFHPLVDRVTFADYRPPVAGRFPEALDGAEGGRSLDAMFRRDMLQWRRPGVFLDPTEQGVADLVARDGPHVAVHPFAGEPHRRWEGHLSTAVLLDWLADHLAGRATIVILGGSSDRRIGGRSTALVEALAYARVKVVNLVGQYSIRLHAHLAATASAFVGTSSCYLAAAQAAGVRSLCITHPSLRFYLAFQQDAYCRYARENGTAVITYDDFNLYGQDLLYALQQWIDGHDTFDDPRKGRRSGHG